jgi:GAF domain-containing protein
MVPESQVRLTPLPVPSTSDKFVSELEGLRREILNRMLNGTSIVATIAFIIAVIFESRIGQWNIILAASVAYTWLLAITLLRRLPYWARTASLLMIIYGMGLASLLVNGLAGTGRIFLFTLPIIASILAGARAGLASIAISIGSILLTGWLISTGKLTLSEAEIVTTATDPGFWITGAFTFLMMGTVSTLTQAGLVRGLERSVEQTRDLTRQLEARQADLENQVKLRTRDLERRFLQIRTAADISRAISDLTSSQDLLNQAVALVKERFDLYYVGVFLLDEHAEYAVLKAGSGEAGQQMLARNHRLLVGGDSMIGWATANRKPRIALDVGQEAVRFNNPYLPATRSEMALPILVGEQVLGAISIQSAQPEAFDIADITVLEGIADSLGTALENTRLFNEVQRSLVEIQTLHGQYLTKAWSELPGQATDLEFTFEAGDSAQDKESRSVEIPLTLRDQVIGSLTLETGPGGLSQAQEALVNSVTTQAALALENIRLFQESQRQAERDRIAAHISSRIWAFMDTDAILHNALKDLGQALNASGGVIQLKGEK